MSNMLLKFFQNTALRISPQTKVPEIFFLKVFSKSEKNDPIFLSVGVENPWSYPWFFSFPHNSHLITKTDGLIFKIYLKFDHFSSRPLLSPQFLPPPSLLWIIIKLVSLLLPVCPPPVYSTEITVILANISFIRSGTLSCFPAHLVKANAFTSVYKSLTV